jgi:adenine-specific DNA-methyltransferase
MPEKIDVKERLIELLREIFQFENEDLDFGIYKILNHKKSQIESFIQKDLIKEITTQLNLIGAEEQKKAAEELEKLKQKLIDLGVEDYEKNPKYQEKKKQLENIKVSQDMEKEIYNHIYAFFSRYYDKGDFISKRRYGKNNKYAIPYNGEETILYWANNDQYYIKTTESFKKYSFKTSRAQVNFRVVEAEEEKANVKSEEKKFFIISRKKVHDFENKTLNIYFDFRALNESEKIKYPKPTQEQINQDNINTIKKGLEKEERAVDLFKEDEKGRTLVEKQLNKYTQRNTSDYFIHKDLKTFLDRELDFYIKNEVVDLSDVTKLELEQFNNYILKVKVIRNIAEKIIDFMAQIENFQKKIWEKKKFVINTNYCITLDYIDEKYYPEILGNKEQLEEWKKLFDLDIDKEAKKLKGKITGHKGTDPKIEVLKQNPTLVLDTKFFGEEFKYKLLGEIDNLDEKTNGILINSENFQALNLLRNKYHKRVKCCYIDPPFNSPSTEILYKNNFKHSSWLSLMDNRVGIAKHCFMDDGILVVAIDENEQERLGFLLSNLFPEHEKTCITVVHNPAGIQGKNFSYTHEFAYFVYPKDGVFIGKTGRGKELISPLRDWGGTSERKLAKNCFYPIVIKNEKIVGFGDVCPEDVHPKSPNIFQRDGSVYIYPLDKNGIERKWVYSRRSAEKNVNQLFVKKINGEYVIIRRKELFTYRTVWDDKRYYANIYGSKLLNNIIPDRFPFPKSLYTVEDCIKAVIHDKNSAIILDFFAGSGTTGHAVLNLNKEDEGNRKFILVEMGQYFDTVLKPRVEKVVFSPNWKEGKPQDNNGSKKQIIKYQSLEQYEDALENIEIPQMTLEEFKDYFVKYMLEFETRGSNTFLNIDALRDPFNYKLKIIDNYEPRTVSVDLVETYNYLIGLEVGKLGVLENKDDSKRRYVSVQGKREGKEVIVIWRSTKDLNPEKDRDFIKANILKGQFGEVHINGDNLIEGAVLIEEQFKRIMNGG